MSRSGYTDDCDDTLQYGRWRAQVASAIRGKRGQAFLRELAQAMDSMPEKALITEELVTADGDCCTMGVICKARGLDVSQVDELCAEEVGGLIGIAHQLAAEILYENDESWMPDETPEQRWGRMRKWVEAQLGVDKGTNSENFPLGHKAMSEPNMKLPEGKTCGDCVNFGEP